MDLTITVIIRTVVLNPGSTLETSQKIFFKRSVGMHITDQLKQNSQGGSHAFVVFKSHPDDSNAARSENHHTRQNDET